MRQFVSLCPNELLGENSRFSIYLLAIMVLQDFDKNIKFMEYMEV